MEQRALRHPRGPGSFGAKDRPAYTTVQTMVYRLEAKKALRRSRKIGNAHIFEARDLAATPPSARLVDEFLAMFGGRMQPVMAAADRGRQSDAEGCRRTPKGCCGNFRQEEERHVIAALLDHLWQSTLFAGGAWLLTLWLRRNPARLRFGCGLPPR